MTHKGFGFFEISFPCRNGSFVVGLICYDYVINILVALLYGTGSETSEANGALEVEVRLCNRMFHFFQNLFHGTCQCTEGPALGDGVTLCQRCGNMAYESEENLMSNLQFEHAREIDSSATTVYHSQVLVSGLPSLPAESDPSGEGNNCAIGEGVNVSDQHGHSSAEKSPVHSKSRMNE